MIWFKSCNYWLLIIVKHLHRPIPITLKLSSHHSIKNWKCYLTFKLIQLWVKESFFQREFGSIHKKWRCFLRTVSWWEIFSTSVLCHTLHSLSLSCTINPRPNSLLLLHFTTGRSKHWVELARTPKGALTLTLSSSLLTTLLTLHSISLCVDKHQNKFSRLKSPTLRLHLMKLRLWKRINGWESLSYML